jgi:hypothetical protein
VAWYATTLAEHALSVLRVTGPLHEAGIEVVEGAAGTSVDIEAVSRADLVLVQRDFPRAYGKFERVVERARAEGKPLVYEIDDLLLELPVEHPYRNTHYFASALLPMLGAALQADAILTSTAELQARYRQINPNTWLVPNFLNERIWPRTPLAPKLPQDPLVIGYLGTDTVPDRRNCASSSTSSDATARR